MDSWGARLRQDLTRVFPASQKLRGDPTPVPCVSHWRPASGNQKACPGQTQGGPARDGRAGGDPANVQPPLGGGRGEGELEGGGVNPTPTSEALAIEDLGVRLPVIRISRMGPPRSRVSISSASRSRPPGTPEPISDAGEESDVSSCLSTRQGSSCSEAVGRRCGMRIKNRTRETASRGPAGLLSKRTLLGAANLEAEKRAERDLLDPTVIEPPVHMSCKRLPPAKEAAAKLWRLPQLILMTSSRQCCPLHTSCGGRVGQGWPGPPKYGDTRSGRVSSGHVALMELMFHQHPGELARLVRGISAKLEARPAQSPLTAPPRGVLGPPPQ
ncbi:hypothetical protein WN55_08615 [Dufourea novaeangliae]|uniref:Uncharacterized protein n=1 Tax=Dufourea novaeangliae TaxID=178035 RepID=A0A154PT13_DUFNO|nr:hypothetical protein WN55_08615 [Dufourea novaeangliae]